MNILFLLFIIHYSNAFFYKLNINKKCNIYRKCFEKELSELNSKNTTIQNNAILNNNKKYPISNKYLKDTFKKFNDSFNESTINPYILPKIVIIDANGEEFNMFGKKIYHDSSSNHETIKSKHFEIIKNSSISFNDIGGYDEVKEELNQIIDFLKFPDKYKNYNIRLPKGIIFEGLPGTGKTLFAKAIATEAKCNFIVSSGSDFSMKYIGEGAEKIKELFNLANKNKPCIIFIDEIDAVGKKRVDDGQSSGKEHDNTLNALLVELNGFQKSDNVILIGATNRIDLLDNALIRPGRIDKIIHIPFPNNQARKSIINLHLKGKPIDYSVSVDNLIDITQGLSGAQIENLLNEAMLFAIRNNKTQISIHDIDSIYDKSIVGWQPLDHDYSNELIEKIAIHEIGHTITSYFSTNYPKIKKVCINLKSPHSPGYTMYEPSKSNFESKEQILDKMMILISGRVAESIVYGNTITSGAHNDFKRIHELAHKYVLDYGMSNLGLISINSDKYLTLLDDEINLIISNIEKKSFLILNNYKPLLLYLGKLLSINKTIYYDEIHQIIQTYIKNQL
uniref:AAA+ ATPase domain-containing protein n=1 Tax=viral metagenome TaxID=1070528 RepID=A0A6C0H527_9ZZZZ